MANHRMAPEVATTAMTEFGHDNIGNMPMKKETAFVKMQKRLQTLCTDIV